LGWFSIGIGLAEIFAPRAVSRLIGVRGDHRILLRVFGLREIASGLGILSQRHPAGWLWARVAGDALDLTFLGGALAAPHAKRTRVAAATAGVLAVSALDWLSAQQMSRQVGWTTNSGNLLIKKTVTIHRSADELYRFWRDFQNLPRFMDDLQAVDDIGNNRSRWTLQGLLGGTIVQWDAEITADQPDQHLSWRAIPPTDIQHAGSVRFIPAPAGRGTTVTVEMEYGAPGGVLGATIGQLLGKDPGQRVQNNLRRFKQLMETGEILRSDGSLRGIGLSEQRSAQPSRQD
jgi:uncharacterized membrane protein